MSIAHIEAAGTPREIGLSHGQGAKAQISRSLKLYEDFFQKSCNLEWSEACETALEFVPAIEAAYPQYLEEMKGVADGADVTFADILTLNARTEIAFGKFVDGCTALSWLSNEHSFLGQNWDWTDAQLENLVVLNIQPLQGPAIKMVTEAGIIGKIGLNEHGVGVLLNAIKALGLDTGRIPCHLALRSVLDSESRAQALEKLRNKGVASSCHILVADAEGGVGIECSSKDLCFLEMDDQGRVLHTNHYILEHDPAIHDTRFMPDSMARIKRIRELTDRLATPPTFSTLANVFKDEENAPFSICRHVGAGADTAGGTIFSILMELRQRRATVLIGRPTAPKEVVDLTWH